jgi:hypothetical protein
LATVVLLAHVAAEQTNNVAPIFQFLRTIHIQKLPVSI